MDQTGAKTGGEVEFEETFFADSAFDHSSEEVKDEHVDDNVPGVKAVKEHVGEELPEEKTAGNKAGHYRKQLDKGFIAAGQKKNDGKEKDGYVNNNKALDCCICAEAPAERRPRAESAIIIHAWLSFSIRVNIYPIVIREGLCWANPSIIIGISD